MPYDEKSEDMRVAINQEYHKYDNYFESNTCSYSTANFIDVGECMISIEESTNGKRLLDGIRQRLLKGNSLMIRPIYSTISTQNNAVNQLFWS